MRPPHYASVVTLAAVLALAAFGIQGHPILKRWVGTYDGRPLTLDFYGDSMLVVNDEYVTGYRLGDRALTVFGDTSFTVAYWFALDRMMIETEGSVLVTMAEQDLLARPMFGRWVGSGFASGQRIELYLGRGGVARWRRVPGGGWTDGEWDRSSRTITFTWLPDSTTWVAQYDPLGSAILIEENGVDGETLVLWHTLR